MIRQVAVLRNGRGYRKGTLMKAQAELPSLKSAVLGLAPVPDGLVRCVYVRRLFSGTDSLPSGSPGSIRSAPGPTRSRQVTGLRLLEPGSAVRPHL